MRKTLLALSAIAATAALSAPAQAVVIAPTGLNLLIEGISGSGQTRWTFSGSAIAGGYGEFDHDNNLGSDDNWFNVGDFTAVNDFEAPAIFSNATLTIGGETRDIDLGYTDNDNFSDDDIGVGVSGTTDFEFTSDDFVSWAGMMIVGIDINTLNLAGLPFSVTTSNFAGDQDALLLNLTIQEIPEPASAALLGLGLAGIAATRCRKVIA